MTLLFIILHIFFFTVSPISHPWPYFSLFLCTFLLPGPGSCAQLLTYLVLGLCMSSLWYLLMFTCLPGNPLHLFQDSFCGHHPPSWTAVMRVSQRYAFSSSLIGGVALQSMTLCPSTLQSHVCINTPRDSAFIRLALSLQRELL